MKIPTGRGSNISDRRVLDEKFLNLIHKRHKVTSNDPDYERKIENRHVLEGNQRQLLSIFTVSFNFLFRDNFSVLVHESYQYMTKNGRWREGFGEDSKTNAEETKEEPTSKPVSF